MNGDDKVYLKGQIDILSAVMAEKWDAHDRRSKELGDGIGTQFRHIEVKLDKVIDELGERPCLVHTEKFKSIIARINWLYGILAGLFIVIISTLIRQLLK